MNAVQGAGFRGIFPAMPGRPLLVALMVGLAAGAAPVPAQEEPAADDAAIAKAAAEWTAAHDSPEAKVVALHRHVRDEIRQVATQWG
jgi:hypothetical protein